MKLIDKEKVIEEIKRRISNHNKELQHASDEDFVSSWASDEENQKLALTALIPFLNTIEVKEVDLVEELDYDDYMTFFKEHPEYNNGDWGFEETWTFGQYCYKLGLKARKGE